MQESQKLHAALQTLSKTSSRDDYNNSFGKKGLLSCMQEAKIACSITILIWNGAAEYYVFMTFGNKHTTRSGFGPA
jgi:hypothetical protein